MNRWLLIFAFALWPIFFVSPAGDTMSEAVLGATVSIVDRGTLEVDEDTALDVNIIDGKFYSGFPLGASLLALPYYIVFKPIIHILPESWAKLDILPKNNPRKGGHKIKKEVYFLQIILVWFFVAPVFGWTCYRVIQFVYQETQNLDWAYLVGSAFGFGTLTLAYSCIYSRNVLVSFLVWNVFLFLMMNRKRSFNRNETVGLGVLLGFTGWIEQQAVLAAFIIAVYSFIRIQDRRLKIIFVSAFALPVIAFFLFQWWHLGSIFTSYYNHRAILDKKFTYAFKFDGEAYDFSPERTRLLGIRHPTIDSIVGLSFSPFKGLFFYSSICFLGLVSWCFRWFQKKDKTALLVLSIFILHFIFVSSISGKFFWSGIPVFFGPRYLLIMCGFLILGLTYLPQTQLWRWNAYLLLANSVAFNLVGMMYNPNAILYPHHYTKHFDNILAKYFEDLFAFGVNNPLLKLYGVSYSTLTFLFVALAVLTVFLIRRSRKAISF